MSSLNWTVILLILYSILAFSKSEEETEPSHWGYDLDDGPDTWCKLFPTGHCCGHRQSPIDIIKNNTKTMPDKLGFYNYKYLPSSFKILNNGHSAIIQLMGMEKMPYVRLNSHKSRFVLDSFHFHWGQAGSNGSEHTIDGQRYPLEMHLVHINNKYKSLTEAREYFNGVIVLSILFEMSGDDNPNYSTLIQSLSDVKPEGSQSTIKQNLLLSSLLPKQIDGLYAYKGSLTTPPCSESVTWFIVENQVPISDSQVERFRKLQAETKPSSMRNSSSLLNHNYRPLQENNNRLVYYLEGDINLNAS